MADRCEALPDSGTHWPTREEPPPLTSPRVGETFERETVKLFFGEAERFYPHWPEPVAIISDGPYGVGGFPGDPHTVEGLPDLYRPHIEMWSRYATPQTTLWFWATELGWATIHPLLTAANWDYRSCHIWDKGASHVAGNANSQTLRKFPVVSEVCVQYVKRALLPSEGVELPLKEWLRAEWRRTGLPFKLTNEACGVADAATRKYFTADHLWYYPPVEAFEAIVAYANKHGRSEGRPYFSRDGNHSLTGEEWAKMRAKFRCEFGVHNVWREPPVRGTERLKEKYRCLHNNQKPLRLIDITIEASTDPGDVVWEPFGGLCSAAVSAHRLGRRCMSAEVLPQYFRAAKERLATYDR